VAVALAGVIYAS